MLYMIKGASNRRPLFIYIDIQDLLQFAPDFIDQSLGMAIQHIR